MLGLCGLPDQEEMLRRFMAHSAQPTNAACTPWLKWLSQEFRTLRGRASDAEVVHLALTRMNAEWANRPQVLHSSWFDKPAPRLPSWVDLSKWASLIE